MLYEKGILFLSVTSARSSKIVCRFSSQDLYKLIYPCCLSRAVPALTAIGLPDSVPA